MAHCYQGQHIPSLPLNSAAFNPWRWMKFCVLQCGKCIWQRSDMGYEKAFFTGRHANI